MGYLCLDGRLGHILSVQDKANQLRRRGEELRRGDDRRSLAEKLLLRVIIVIVVGIQNASRDREVIIQHRQLPVLLAEEMPLGESLGQGCIWVHLDIPAPSLPHQPQALILDPLAQVLYEWAYMLDGLGKVSDNTVSRNGAAGYRKLLFQGGGGKTSDDDSSDGNTNLLHGLSQFLVEVANGGRLHDSNLGAQDEALPHEREKFKYVVRHQSFHGIQHAGDNEVSPLVSL